MQETFVNTIDGHELYAARSVSDEGGNNIRSTYATKSQLPTRTSDLTNDSSYVSHISLTYDESTYADALAAINAKKNIYVIEGSAVFPVCGYSIDSGNIILAVAIFDEVSSTRVYYINRDTSEWVMAGYGPFLEDAVSNNKIYARRNGNWVEIKSSTVFIAKYNASTFAEVNNAYNTGCPIFFSFDDEYSKDVYIPIEVCRHDNEISIMVNFTYGRTTGIAQYEYKVDDTNTWSISNIYLPQLPSYEGDSKLMVQTGRSTVGSHWEEIYDTTIGITINGTTHTVSNILRRTSSDYTFDLGNYVETIGDTMSGALHIQPDTVTAMTAMLDTPSSISIGSSESDTMQAYMLARDSSEATGPVAADVTIGSAQDATGAYSTMAYIRQRNSDNGVGNSPDMAIGIGKDASNRYNAFINEGRRVYNIVRGDSSGYPVKYIKVVNRMPSTAELEEGVLYAVMESDVAQVTPVYGSLGYDVSYLTTWKSDFSTDVHNVYVSDVSHPWYDIADDDGKLQAILREPDSTNYYATFYIDIENELDLSDGAYLALDVGSYNSEVDPSRSSAGGGAEWNAYNTLSIRFIDANGNGSQWLKVGGTSPYLDSDDSIHGDISMGRTDISSYLAVANFDRSAIVKIEISLMGHPSVVSYKARNKGVWLNNIVVSHSLTETPSEGDHTNSLRSTSGGKVYQHVSPTYQSLSTSDFNSAGDIYDAVDTENGDRVIFVLRHSERSADTSRTASLTSNGVSLVLDNAADQLTGLPFDDPSTDLYMSSNVKRCVESSYLVGHARGNTTMAVSGTLGDDWDSISVVEHSDRGANRYLNNTFTTDTSWPLAQYYYKNNTESCSNRCVEVINWLAGQSEGHPFTYATSHDLCLIPFVCWATGDGDFFSSWTGSYDNPVGWLNYLSGIAVIVHTDGTWEVYPATLNDSGKFV